MKTEYYFNNVIVGGSFESLLYSFINDIPILVKDPILPFELEKETELDKYSFLGYSGIREVYKTELWDRLSFLLSMNGTILMPNIIKNIRNEAKCFSITTSDNTRIKIRYSNRIDFDKTIKSSVNVYDWFHVRSGTMHHFNLIKDPKSKFVNKLFFYSSKRSSTTRSMKDVVACSKIKNSDLLNYEYSEAYARLKTLKMMKDEGIRGRPNGYNKRGLRLHYAIKIEHSHRQIIKNYKPLHTVDEILNQKRQKGKLWTSTQKLFPQEQTLTLPASYQLPVKV